MNFIFAALLLPVVLAWDPISEPDLAGYKLHWGPTSGSPTTHFDVGNVTQVTLNNSTLPDPAYFTVTAYCRDLSENRPSNEVIFAQAAPTPTPDPGLVNIGLTTLGSIGDSNNGDVLVAQRATLSVPGVLQSLSFYVTIASGTLRLGVYDASGPGGGPGLKIAETAEIVPIVGWNKANTLPIVLPAGTYWLAYFPSSDSLAFLRSTLGTARYYALAYGPLPSVFSLAPSSIQTSWSFYATFSTDVPVPTPTPAPTPAETPGLLQKKGYFEGNIELDGILIPQPTP